ncbi:MAG TPA: DUF58 domain-containing protein [Tepidisphaeraceae bacterium]|nr:DUF58 domain-containing protein [Tepidisphaeraceae bacterium]
MSLVSRYLDPMLLERLNHLQLSARSVVEGSTTGLHRSPVKGASIEFRQHRFYVPGDDPRRLDWRVLARTDRPYVREYDEETNLRCAIVLDRSGSMGYGLKHGTKFEFAARMAASLAYLMLGQTEAVGLAMAGSRVDSWLPPRAGTPQLARIIEVLERTAPAGESDMARYVQEVAERLERRALVMLLSDCFTPISRIRAALARLRHDRHEVIVMRVLDDDETTFPFRRWSRFRGLEGEPSQACEPALVRKQYLDRFRWHAAQLEAGCRALHCELHTLVTDRPLEQSLTGFLQHRHVAQSAGG